eukprot:gene5263-5498_t
MQPFASHSKTANSNSRSLSGINARSAANSNGGKARCVRQKAAARSAAAGDCWDDAEKGAPWSLTFDLRERETDWTEANKARLVAIVAAQQLSLPTSEMEQRLDDLMLLLPDLAGKVPKLPPQLVAGLTADLAVTSRRLLALKQLLPAANISWLVSERPQLLLQESAELVAAVEALKQLLQLEHVDKLVEAQPLFLVTPCVEQVMQEISRLMPSCKDPAALLVSDPDMLLRLQRGQKYLGMHPDSDPGEQITWQPLVQ